MLAEERLNRIMAIVEERKSVTVTELTELLDSSESTVRRDLTALHKRKKLIKVHGGATAIDLNYMTRDAAVSERQDLNMTEKDRIGKYAAALIQKDDFVYIDAGTTTECFVNHIVEKEAVYVTNAVAHARKLLQKGCRVFLIGGELKPKTEAVIGAEALLGLQKYNFTKGFFGANGIHREYGITTPDVSEAAVKGKAMEQCRRKFVLSDSSKIGQISLVKFAELEEVEIITTRVKQKVYQKYKNIVEVENHDLYGNI